MGADLSLYPSREMRFVFLASAYPMPEPYIAMAKALVDEGLDIGEVLHIAYEGKVYCLLAANIRQHFPKLGQVSSRFTKDGTTDAVRELYRNAEEYRRYAMRLSGETTRVLRILEAAEIPCVPLGGVVLSKILYGEPTLRVQAGAVQIRVEAEAQEAAEAALLGQGFSATDKRHTCVSPAGIHFRIRKQTEPYVEENVLATSEARERIDVYGHAFPAYPSELLLLYTAAHAASDGCRVLRDAVDFDAALRLARHDMAKAEAYASANECACLLTDISWLCAMLRGDCDVAYNERVHALMEVLLGGGSDALARARESIEEALEEESEAANVPAEAEKNDGEAEEKPKKRGLLGYLLGRR